MTNSPRTMRRRGDHVILAVHVTERTRQAGRVQTVLTRHGDRFTADRLGAFGFVPLVDDARRLTSGRMPAP